MDQQSLISLRHAVDGPSIFFLRFVRQPNQELHNSIMLFTFIG
ncbi:hypothetical protein [Aeromonas veronii]